MEPDRREGIVRERLPNRRYRVELEDGRVIEAYVQGKMGMNFVRLLPGDRVRVALSPFDAARGRILFGDA